MIISDGQRLALYVLMGIFPVWSDWAAKSMDVTFRGLFMPILASLSTAVAIALAKTSTRKESPAEPVEVVAPKGEPLKVVETKPAKKNK